MNLPQPGEQFQGKYALLDVLGRGGFAAVYLAQDVEIGRKVAIKILMPRGDERDGQREARFMREARVVAGLRDPHTITMYDFGTTADGLLFMVFEFVDSIDLVEALRRNGPLRPDIVQHIVCQVLEALGEAHESGVLHRDLKPANILTYEHLGDPWRVKLIDFGIAKPLPLENPERDHTRLTREGAIVGTPRYMPPEAFFGEEQRAASDLYSLGLVAIELLTGEPALTGAKTDDVVRSALSLEPLPVPPTPGADRLAPALAWMVRREMDERPRSAQEVYRFLKQPSVPLAPAAASQSQQVVIPRPAPVRPPEKKGVTPSVAVALVAVATVCAGAALWTLSEHFEEQSAAPAPTVSRPNPFGHEGSVAARTAPPVEEAADLGVSHLADTGPDAGASGCGRPVPWRGVRRFGIRLYGEERTWDVYVPRAYDENVRHRVVLMFHNSMRTGQGFMLGTKFQELADDENLLVVAPASPGTRPWFKPGEMELVERSLETLKADLCVDERWIYAVGHGGGGDFAQKLRCEIPLSAVAATGAGEHIEFEQCESKPTPFIRMYGTKDKYVPAAGGIGCYDGKMFKSAEQLEQQWTALNKALDGPKPWSKHRNGTCEIWEGEAPFVHCAMDGGHDWPEWYNLIDVPGCGAKPPQFPMRDTIWRFFQEHAVELPESGG